MQPLLNPHPVRTATSTVRLAVRLAVLILVLLRSEANFEIRSNYYLIFGIFTSQEPGVGSHPKQVIVKASVNAYTVHRNSNQDFDICVIPSKQLGTTDLASDRPGS